jgi:hypothetical protein
MSDTTTVIEAIRRRPGMYLGVKSLTALHQFLNGYQMACGFHQIKDDRLGLRIPPDFHDWVAYRTHFQESTTGWCNMIVATTKSEEDAFDRFFELLEEHAHRVPRVVAEILGPNSCTNRDHLVPPPERVRLVKFTEDPGFFALHGNKDWRDRFYPYLSWMHGLYGGEWVIHDEASYSEMIREDQEWERALEERVGIRGEDPAP